MIRKFFLLALLCVSQLVVMAQSDTLRHEVLFETSMGDIKVVLYNETPKHRDNFLKLVKKGYYDGTLFHRVISQFMIQGGDSTTRHAKPNVEVGEYSPSYTIPAEIVYPQYFNKRGALAAAREGDDVNPDRVSSSSQFYIVYGRRYSDYQLDQVQTTLYQKTMGKTRMTDEIRKYYQRIGGAAHLDGQYTVFGEVVAGLEIVEKIQSVETDKNDRPLQDVKILRARVLQ